MRVRILRPRPETPDEQEVKTRSGVIITKDAQGKHRSYSIFSRIVTLLAESNSLKFAVPGGADWCQNMDRSDFVLPTDSLGKCWVLWGSYPWYICR
jgi:hypothetical protein